MNCVCFFLIGSIIVKFHLSGFISYFIGWSSLQTELDLFNMFIVHTHLMLVFSANIIALIQSTNSISFQFIHINCLVYGILSLSYYHYDYYYNYYYPGCVFDWHIQINHYHYDSHYKFNKFFVYFVFILSSFYF